MKPAIRNTLLAAMLAVASAGAFAAESADLTVSGTIRPSACSIQLTNGGVADYGTVSAVTLNETAGTHIGTRNVGFTISCDAATRVGFTTTDNRAGTMGESARAAAGIGGSQMVGLGAVDGRSIGAYDIVIWSGSIRGDGEQPVVIYSQNAGASWTLTGIESGAYIQPGIRTTSWARQGNSTPDAFTTLSGNLAINTYINAKRDLPSFTGGLSVDGSLTLQLQYL